MLHLARRIRGVRILTDAQLHTRLRAHYRLRGTDGDYLAGDDREVRRAAIRALNLARQLVGLGPARFPKTLPGMAGALRAVAEEVAGRLAGQPPLVKHCRLRLSGYHVAASHNGQRRRA